MLSVAWAEACATHGREQAALTPESSPHSATSAPNDVLFGVVTLDNPNQLLYDPDHGVVIGYAARSASTLMVELFLHSIDKLRDAVTEAERIGKIKPHNFAKKQLPARYHV